MLLGITQMRFTLIAPPIVIFALACSPFQQQTTEDIAPPASGMPCVLVRAAPSQYLIQLDVRGLAKGRYAVFTSNRPPHDKAALLTTDFAQECAQQPLPASDVDAGSDAGVKEVPREWAPCVAQGLFDEGTDGRFAVVSIDSVDSASTKAQFSVWKLQPYVTILALDGSNMVSAPVVLTAFSEGADSCGSDAPSIDAVATR
jgi:hypothetical protein